MALTTLARVKEYGQIDAADTSADNLLTWMIDAASSSIEQYCSRKFASATYTEVRDGDTIIVEVFNLVPADGSTACAEVYTTVEHTIPLGSDFVPGDTYTVSVNGTELLFVAE